MKCEHYSKTANIRYYTYPGNKILTGKWPLYQRAKKHWKIAPNLFWFRIKKTLSGVNLSGVSGAHFIDLERMSGSVDHGVTLKTELLNW